MGRLPRVYVKGALYYIMCTVSGSQSLFKDDKDRNTYLALLWRYKAENGFLVFGYVLQPKIIYLLIEPISSYNISQIMHALNSNYTKYYNTRYQVKGHLFRGRFGSKVVERDEYLLEVVRYLHYRPVLDNLAAKIDDYQWTSYRMLFGKSEETEPAGRIPLSEEKGQILRDLEKRGIAAEAIYGFLSDYSQIDEFGRLLRKHHIIGKEEFIEMSRLKPSLVSQPTLEPGSQPATEPGIQVAAIPGAQVGISNWLVKVGVVGVVILLCLNAYLFMMNLGLRKEAQNYIISKEAGFMAKLITEKQKIRNDLDEKYRADVVSYEAMSRRLEIEKEKIKELESKLGEI